MRYALLFVALLLFPGLAHAEWLESSSDHFVVYGRSDEKNLRRFSEQLERYQAAMAFVTAFKTPKPSPSNRVTVFLVDSEDTVQQLMGKGSKFVGGFYIPSAGGSIAIIPRVSSAGNGQQIDGSMITLLHEYAHHFLISSSGFASPRWLSEGAAEFFSSAKFGADGGVGIGLPANHRGAELNFSTDVKARELLDPAEYDKHFGKSTAYNAFYGKSWLLYHYLVFDPSRAGQLPKYGSLLARGVPLNQAAEQAFGDLDTLEQNIKKYQLKSTLQYWGIKGAVLPIGQIAMRKLSAGEAAMMPILIRSRRGVTKEQAGKLVIEARAVAAKFPADAAVEGALAEAEYDAGNDALAITAADKAIATDPKLTNAYVQKGYALMRMAESASDQTKAYRAARAPFLALNAIENDHPLPLYYYYLSYLRQGVKPSANAVDGLMHSVELAPFDFSLRMSAAMQSLHDKNGAMAKYYFTPIAYNPHGGKMAEKVRGWIERLDRDPKWDGADIGKFQIDDDSGDGG